MLQAPTPLQKHAAQSGFTLIELMVTISIVVLTTGLVMIRYSSFNSSVLLNGQAYEVAFDIRETQSLAISVRGNNNEFRQEYGMYFALEHPSRYILYQDTNDQEPPRFDAALNEAVGEPYTLDPRFVLVDLCGVTMNGLRRCASTDGVPQAVSVAFARPDFDAAMYGDDLGTLQQVEIFVASDPEASVQRKVVVTRSGQISVD